MLSTQLLYFLFFAKKIFTSPNANILHKPHKNLANSNLSNKKNHDDRICIICTSVYNIVICLSSIILRTVRKYSIPFYRIDRFIVP